MIAAVAALGLGAYSCQNGPGDDLGKPGDGEGTGMLMTIRMSSAHGGTRADDFDPIKATAAEDILASIDIWVFDADGNKPDDNALHHKRFTVGDHLATTTEFIETEERSGIFEMQAPWRTLAGDVRVWVGTNLPNGLADTNFATEALMLDVVNDIADLSTLSETKGLAMFSSPANAEVTFQLIPRGETFDDQEDGFNEVTIPVYRIVSKAVATYDQGGDWEIEWTGDNAPTLTYTATHWRVMQYAYSTWDAPHYDVAKYNSVAPDGGNVRPATYANLPTPGGIANYERGIEGQGGDATGTATELYFGSFGGDDDVLSANAVADKEAIYIGENSRIGVDAVGSLNKNTTFAYISAGVLVDKIATWDTSAKTIVWANADEPYGMVNEDNEDNENTDIILIYWNGKEYFMPATGDVTPGPDGDGTDDGVAVIINGIAASLGQMVLADQNAVQAVIDQWILDNPTLTYPTHYDGPTLITMEEFKADQGFATYTYPQGYVHFLYWINPYQNVRNNQYEVLRNQFIHLSVNGMAANDGHFPGRPGDPEYPRIPIDPTEDENNPDPLEPDDPVDPAPTDVIIHVEAKPWTYRVNDILLQR